MNWNWFFFFIDSIVIFPTSCCFRKTTIFIFSGLIRIQEEWRHLHSTYKILSARDGEIGRELAVVKQKSLWHDTWSINSVYGEYKLEGLNLKSHSVTLTKEGRTVAIVNNKHSLTVSSYEVEIDDAEDHAFIMALAIIINQVLRSYLAAV
jgi:uncharacterized protein YxjI